MDDQQILDLYWTRSETALSETAAKYGRYCHYIAYNILRSHEDSEECVNDTYLRAWGTIPPQRPNRFSVFLGTITRNLSLDRYKRRATGKRGYGQIPLVLDELQECVPSSDNTAQVVDHLVLVETLNRFLDDLSGDMRKIFMRRYWYMSSIREISADFGMSESNVKMSLLRSRKKLRALLEKEGFSL